MVETSMPFSLLLYKQANIVVDNGFRNCSFPNDNPRDWPRTRVRQRVCDAEEEPPKIPTEDELPLDPYNVALRPYQEKMGRGVNFTNMHLDILMQHMNIQRLIVYPMSYPTLEHGTRFEWSNIEKLAKVDEDMITMSEIILFYLLSGFKTILFIFV
ncbi:unnamed protein product [Lactuca saligna]|uniref:Uncharacterized protein n=1 Tax=Lactuca saligna TaxID=75948 RepID=A0AA36E2Q2_LACSI|nr:unnamed protein product [Lactuca saligna]